MRHGATVFRPQGGLCEQALEGALVAEDVDGGVPDDVDASEAVGGPLIDLIEALGAEVVDESEEIGVAESKRHKVGAGGGDECDADAESPGMGIDIEGSELAVVGQVGLVRGSGGGEAVDDVAGDGDDGVRVERIGVGEIVFGGAILGKELIEIVVGEKAAIAALPGADVDASDGECVGGLSGAEEHGASMARETAVSDSWLVVRKAPAMVVSDSWLVVRNEEATRRRRCEGVEE